MILSLSVHPAFIIVVSTGSRLENIGPSPLPPTLIAGGHGGPINNSLPLGPGSGTVSSHLLSLCKKCRGHGVDTIDKRQSNRW